MRVACIIVLLASGASGESDECAAGPDGAQICREDVAIGDTTSLLQVHNRQLETVAATLTRRCSTDAIPPDCTFGEWEQWSACSKTCATGTRKRSRRVTSQGKETCCTEEGEICNVDPCPTPCKVGEWTEWGACSETCGWGMRKRSRELISAGSSDDPECCAEEGVQCKIKDCPVPVPQTVVAVVVREAINSRNTISGAKVTIGEKEGTTDAVGEVSFNLAAAEYDLVATHPDYMKVETKLTVTAGMPIQFVDMLKPQSAHDWVIVLKWGQRPLDLDAKTFWNLPASGTGYGANYVSYDQPTDSGAGISGHLDQDFCFHLDGGNKYTCKHSGPMGENQKNSPRPETTTLKGVDGPAGEVVFQVNDFWQAAQYSSLRETNRASWPANDTGTFKGSEAVVTVFHGDAAKPVATFTAPNDGYWQWENAPLKGDPEGSAMEWWVFSIDRESQKVHMCDCTKGSPGYCGGCGR